MSTPDLVRAMHFYCETLGGSVGYRFPPDGDPEYVGVDLGAAHVGLALDRSLAGDAKQGRWSLWVYVDECDQAIDRLRAAGVTIVEEPADQPWGERIARVRDPDGNVVILGSPPPAG